MAVFKAQFSTFNSQSQPESLPACPSVVWWGYVVSGSAALSACRSKATRENVADPGGTVGLIARPCPQDTGAKCDWKLRGVRSRIAQEENRWGGYAGKDWGGYDCRGFRSSSTCCEELESEACRWITLRAPRNRRRR